MFCSCHGYSIEFVNSTYFPRLGHLTNKLCVKPTVVVVFIVCQAHSSCCVLCLIVVKLLTRKQSNPE